MKISIMAAQAVALVSCFLVSDLMAQAQPAVAPISPSQADLVPLGGLLLDILDEPHIDC